VAPIKTIKMAFFGATAMAAISTIAVSNSNARPLPVQSVLSNTAFSKWGLSAEDWQQLKDSELFEKAGGASQFQTFLDAANARDSLAMVLTGIAYEKRAEFPSDNIEINLTEARSWYRAAALAGETRGMLNLAAMLSGVAEENGNESENMAEAVRWYNAAALAGNTEAMLSLGTLLVQGRGVMVNNGAAVNWFRIAAEAGNVQAMAALSFMIISDKAKPNFDGEAEHWLRLASNSSAEQPDFGGFGMALFSDYDRALSEKDSLDWSRISANAGDPDSMLMLGYLLENGTEVTHNLVEARQWYQRSAEAGNTEAMVRLADMFANGRGGVKNEIEAKRWYRSAADRGDVWGMIFLGSMLAQGRGGATNTVEAERWYLAAANKAGEKNLYYTLVMHYEGETTAPKNGEIARFFQTQSDLNQSNSMLVLGMLLQKGIGIARNDEAAISIWRRAAQIGGVAGTNAADALQELHGIICVPTGTSYRCPN